LLGTFFADYFIVVFLLRFFMRFFFIWGFFGRLGSYSWSLRNLGLRIEINFLQYNFVIALFL